MPEIWLGYGDSEIILDIKYENIQNIIKPEINVQNPENLSTSIRKNVNLQNSSVILVTTPFPKMMEIIKIIREMSNELGIMSVDVFLLSKSYSLRLRQDISKESLDITRIESGEVLKKISIYKNVILIDKIEYDPVFGFSGSPVKLIRECYPQVMNQIYASVIGEPPKPGLCGEALKISVEELSNMDCQLIHVFSNREAIDSLFFEPDIRSFVNTVNSFKEKTSITSNLSKSAFISGNSTYTSQMTLGNSLNLLWNNCHSVSDGGTIVLLSENRGGINEGAISKYVEGRLDLNGLDKYQYIYELEHINFLQVLREKYEIILISTLPQVYLNKVGLRSISKIKDGLDWIIKKNGKFSKTNIIPTSEITMVTNNTS
jgi:hypothetical protein